MLPINSKEVNILLLPLSSRLIGSIWYNSFGEYMAEINKKVWA